MSVNRIASLAESIERATQRVQRWPRWKRWDLPEPQEHGIVVFFAITRFRVHVSPKAEPTNRLLRGSGNAK